MPGAAVHRSLCAALAGLVLLLVLPALAGAATFTVNDAGDAGDGQCDLTCTLRDAVFSANTNGNPVTEDRIEFSFPAHAGSTVVLSAVQGGHPLLESVAIDGRTHAGPAGGWGIRVDGTGSPAGFSAFTIDKPAAPVTIRGLAIGGFAGNAASSAGIVVVGAGPMAHVIEDNAIGFQGDGLTAAPNTAMSGVTVQGADGVTVRRNVLGNNAFNGVNVRARTDDTQIVDNRIGIGATGTTPAPNTDGGVRIGSVDLSPVERTLVRGNVIRSNGRGGVFTTPDDRATTITQNSIFDNSLQTPGLYLGIDQERDSAVAPINTDLLTDLRGQNRPELTSGALAGTVAGALTSAPGGTYRVEVFGSTACNATGFGEGETYLGAVTVVAGAGGTPFSLTVPVGGAQSVLTATATRTAPTAGGTSEFSNCVVASAGGGGPASPGGGDSPGGSAPLLPLLSRRVVGALVSGGVLVTVPGGKPFALTSDRAAIPFGSRVDARRGKARVIADDGRGGVYDAVFYDGVFRLRQAGTPRDPIVELELVEDVGLAACPRPKAARPAGAAKKKRRPGSRGLWGDGKGRFRIRGRHSAATVRGTIWFVGDSCAGTRTRVRSGVVGARDFTRRKTVIVRAGRSYLARPPRR